MAKKKKMAAKILKSAQHPLRTSPYVSRPDTLHFGPNHQPYYVPEVLLQNLENLPIRDPWTGQIQLGDVDVGTGHVLIHYLHTAAYQTLDDSEDETADSPGTKTAKNEFRKAVLTLGAATRFELAGLQQLAQVEIARTDTDISLHDTVQIIQESLIAGAFHEPTWIQAYISQKVRSAYKRESGLLSGSDIFSGIENPMLIKFLAQTVVGLYDEELLRLRKEKVARKHTKKHAEASADGANAPTLSSNEGVSTTMANETVEPTRAVLGVIEHSTEEVADSIAEPSHPIVEASAAEEILPVTFAGDVGDPSGFQTTSSMENGRAESPVPMENPSLPLDPPSAMEDLLGVPVKAPVDEPVEVFVDEPVGAHVYEVPAVNPFAGLSKSQRKKLEKKMKEEAAAKEREAVEYAKLEAEQVELKRFEEEAEAQRLEEEEALAAVASRTKFEPAGDQYDGDGSSLISKMEETSKDSRSLAYDFLEPPTPREEPVPRLQGDSVTLEAVLDDDKPAIAGLKLNDIADTRGEWGLGTTVSKKDKKKTKKKKTEKNAGIPEDCPTSLPTPEVVAGSDFIEPEPEPTLAVEVREALDPEAELVAISSSRACSSIREHLSESGGWKGCKPCELYVQQVISKLHSAGLPDVNGIGIYRQ